MACLRTPKPVSGGEWERGSGSCKTTMEGSNAERKEDMANWCQNRLRGYLAGGFDVATSVALVFFVLMDEEHVEHTMNFDRNSRPDITETGDSPQPHAMLDGTAMTGIDHCGGTGDPLPKLDRVRETHQTAIQRNPFAALSIGFLGGTVINAVL